MEETKTDKSKVTVRVPKRFWKNGKPEYMEWREYRLRTKKMANGYIVTLGAVRTDTHIFLGASACSPDDVYLESTAVNLAMGRARQSAFLFGYGHRVILDSLVCSDSGLVIRSEEGIRDFIELGSTTVENLEYINGIGIIQVEEFQKLHVGLRRVAAPYYDVVASKAEQSAVYRTIAALNSDFGHRYEFTSEPIHPQRKPLL